MNLIILHLIILISFIIFYSHLYHIAISIIFISFNAIPLLYDIYSLIEQTIHFEPLNYLIIVSYSIQPQNCAYLCLTFSLFIYLNSLYLTHFLHYFIPFSVSFIQKNSIRFYIVDLPQLSCFESFKYKYLFMIASDLK